MSILKLYRLYCTNCSGEYKESFDEIDDVMKYASKDGWVQQQVPNGSLWEFCPKCIKDIGRDEIENVYIPVDFEDHE